MFRVFLNLKANDMLALFEVVALSHVVSDIPGSRTITSTVKGVLY